MRNMDIKPCEHWLLEVFGLYFSYEEKNLEKKIILLSDISNIDNESIILVNLKSK